MNFPEFFTLGFWNQLARPHLPELIMVLTAVVVTLLDRPIRRTVARITNKHGHLFRFGIFLAVCSVGYAIMALGIAWLLRTGLLYQQGAYMAPFVLGILLIVAMEAMRQKQV